MKLLLIATVIFFSVSNCFAKATLAEAVPRDSLLHVKKLIEKELSGSVIREEERQCWEWVVQELIGEFISIGSNLIDS